MTQVMLSPWGQQCPHQPQPSWPSFPAHPGVPLTVAGSSMGSGISTKLATR